MIDFKSWLTPPPPTSAAPPPDARERTTIKVEIAIVLLVTFGLSGMSSILSLIEDALQTAALSDQTVARYCHAVEKDFIDLDRVVDRPDGTHFDAGRRQRHDERGEAAVTARSGIRPDQGESHIGPVPVGDPRLLPVEHPTAVVVANTPAPHPGDVAARVGFTEQLTPDVLTAPDRREQRGLLFLRAEMQEHVGCQVDLVDRSRGAGTQDLLADDAIVQRMVVGPATVLDGPVRADESGVEQPGEPGAQRCLLFGTLRRAAAFPRLEWWSVVGYVRSHPRSELGQLICVGPAAGTTHQPTSAA